ncbi:MAG: LysM peptidoglycan-binding domain-containing protein [Opitutales bacterium]|nr:LysM peptidoglycan-binding domain-containing protein [Opitutales bacterium]
MKFTSIFSIILLAHMGLIGLLLVQPGCKSQSIESGPPQAQTQAPRSGSGESRSEPTRSTRDGDLDPAFNAGLNGSETTTASRDSGSRSGSLAQPTRPPERDTSAPSRTRTEDRSEGILQPLGTGDSDRSGAGTASTEDYRTYEVSSGDTLTHIARREGVSLAALLEANGLNRDSTIFVGQSLRIPGSGNGESAASSTGSTSTPSDSGTTSYEVRSGDTLSGIASRHNTTVAQIRSVNQLRSDTIRVGQTLQIPNGSRSSSSDRSTPSESGSTQRGNGEVHTVQSGETPSHIARRYGISVSALMEANGITDARRIQVGQRLNIPGGTSGSARTASSEPAARERSEPAPRSTSTTTSRANDIPLIDSTTRPRNIEERPSQPSIMDLELLDDEDLPFADVERVND